MKKFSKELSAMTVFLVVCFISVFLVNEVFVREAGTQPAMATTSAENQFGEGFIQVDVHLLGIDPLKEHLTLELQFVPHGRFTQGDGLLSTPLEVLINGTTLTRKAFVAGERMYPFETELDFHEGEVENYPFDQHRAQLEILVKSGTGIDGRVLSLPTQLNFFGSHHSYQFQNSPLPPSVNGYVGYDILMKRSPLVIGTAIFWMAIIWGLTIVNVFLFTGVLMNKVKADFGLFGYMSGFIVALYFFRQMFPEIPPFLGVFSDYLSLFWAILVAAAIAMIVAVKWLISVFKDEDGVPDSIG